MFISHHFINVLKLLGSEFPLFFYLSYIFIMVVILILLYFVNDHFQLSLAWQLRSCALENLVESTIFSADDLSRKLWKQNTKCRCPSIRDWKHASGWNELKFKCQMFLLKKIIKWYFFCRIDKRFGYTIYLTKTDYNLHSFLVDYLRL